MDRRKALKRAYKDTPRPMGVYQIKNLKNGKVFIGSSLNIPGRINSHRFQLRLQCHRNQKLQEDWLTYGSKVFVFETLEEIKPGDIPKSEWRKAVTSLEEKWLADLSPFGENGYN